MPNFVFVGLFCRLLAAKKTKFCPFWILAFCDVATWQESEKVEHGHTAAQLQTFHYPTASKSFPYSNAFMAKSGAQTLTFKSVRNKQTDKETDRKTQRFWPSRRRVKSEPNQTWHGDKGP